jgi:hypothetical protein
VNRTLLMALSALLVAGCPTPAPSSLATSSPPTPSSSPTPSADAAWLFLELPDDDHANFASIAATAHDVVIVGGRDMAPVAWASHDGGAWTFEQLPPESGFPGSLHVFGDRLLAVGGVETSRCAHPAATVFWVRSADGRWQVAPFDELFCAGGGSASVAVAGGRAGIIGAGTGDVPFAWVSDDGLAWVDTGFPAQMFPMLLTAMGGGFAALGTRDERWLFARNAGRPPWTVTDLPLLPFQAEAIGLAEVGGGVIAWFVRTDGQAFGLTSKTGDVWESVRLVGLEGVKLQGVVRSPDGYVALGAVPAGPRMFVSRDGANWRQVVGPADASLASYDDVALSGDRAILLGTVAMGDGRAGLAWGGPASWFEP